MSTQFSNFPRIGIGGTVNWLLSGAVGGLAGTLLFGSLLWAVDSSAVSEAIPTIYGLGPSAAIGWSFHLVHGLVLGALFGFLLSREPIVGALTADAETDVVDALGYRARVSLAGMIYGLAVWGLLPVITQAIWTFTGGADPGFPTVAVESLVGHVLYGLILGVLFAAFVEMAPQATEAEPPFEETDAAVE